VRQARREVRGRDADARSPTEVGGFANVAGRLTTVGERARERQQWTR